MNFIKNVCCLLGKKLLGLGFLMCGGSDYKCSICKHKMQVIHNKLFLACNNCFDNEPYLMSKECVPIKKIDAYSLEKD